MQAISRNRNSAWGDPAYHPAMDIDPQQWPVLSRLLDQALDVPAAERERWLAELPVEHASFRDMLQDLLKHHDDAETGDFLATGPKFPYSKPVSRAALEDAIRAIVRTKLLKR